MAKGKAYWGRWFYIHIETFIKFSYWLFWLKKDKSFGETHFRLFGWNKIHYWY